MLVEHTYQCFVLRPEDLATHCGLMCKGAWGCRGGGQAAETGGQRSGGVVRVWADMSGAAKRPLEKKPLQVLSPEDDVGERAYYQQACDMLAEANMFCPVNTAFHTHCRRFLFRLLPPDAGGRVDSSKFGCPAFRPQAQEAVLHGTVRLRYNKKARAELVRYLAALVTHGGPRM
jgi:hypothetical protein